jgi:hypothetical protein
MMFRPAVDGLSQGFGKGSAVDGVLDVSIFGEPRIGIG